MPLFIDRLPFHYWIDRTRQPPQSHWSVVLPVFLTDVAALAPPTTVVAQDWAVDTANRGPAFAWRHHLLLAGLDPDRARRPSQVTITTALGSKATVPVRLASLWLISNLPAFQGMPWRLPLLPGLPFRDVATLPDPEFNRPLIGLRTLRRAGLRIEIDCAADTVSVWTPDGSWP